jgi:transcriptional regulator with XRE-family HTH domain
MNENRDYSKECGIRCRQIRMSKGMSQQALAEIVKVTPAAISKWEKEGVSNIDHIMRLSAALGQDITADQFDQDGNLTEVGKEILKIVINEGGYADFDLLESSMYGMKADRIGNELFKLERVGAVIREQFKDFRNDERDGIFITAKGVIVYKNSLSFPNFIKEETLEAVITMDERLEDGQNSFQDVIDLDKITPVLMAMKPIHTGFRCDYLKYLYEGFHKPILEHRSDNFSFISSLGDFLVGKSCYIDILRRMAQSAERKMIDSAIGLRYTYTYDDDGSDLYIQELAAAEVDYEDANAVNYFCNVIEAMPHPADLCDYDEDKWHYDSPNEGVQDVIKKLNERYYPEASKEYGHFGEISKKLSDNEERFFSEIDDDKKGIPEFWFSDEDVRAFVEKNISPPSTDDERKIDLALKEIWEADDRTRDYYYSFPQRWEDNGLAKLIRERVGVPFTARYDDPHYWDDYIESMKEKHDAQE